MAHPSYGTPVCPTLPRRAPWPHTPVRAWGVQDVTTHATLRSRRTKAQPVSHVQGLGDGDAPTSPIKDTRLEGVGCRPMLGREARPPGPHPQPHAAPWSPTPEAHATAGSAIRLRPRFRLLLAAAEYALRASSCRCTGCRHATWSAGEEPWQHDRPPPTTSHPVSRRSISTTLSQILPRHRSPSRSRSRWQYLA